MAAILPFQCPNRRYLSAFPGSGGALAGHRAALARLIGAPEAEEVVFTPSTSGGFQLLAQALAPQFAPGDEVILTVFDHESNIGPWQVLAERGVTFRFWALDPKTRLPRLEDLDALLGRRRAWSP